jgi:2-polyprenyl-3-methyl-5-hydroxy-6-metoxy-1,4-benzoquinol methylase
MDSEIDGFNEIHVWSFDALETSELSESLFKKYFDTLGEGDAILDIGCGQGNLVRALQQRGHKVLGVDTNLELIEVAQAESIPVKQMDALTAIQQESDFNIFSMMDFVEHISLRTLHDLLNAISAKPNSTVWIQTPNLDSVIGIKFWFQVPSHITPLNPFVLRKLLARFNFEIVQEWTAYGELPWSGFRKWLSLKILNGLFGAPVASMFVGGANICLVARQRPT